MHTNRLANEKSPYLLQHAHNPVDWYPWGPEAFEKARAEDKPIFLSIGYSTCHWCHVMERESFENERNRRGAQSLLRAHESGSRRAAGRGPHLHDVRAGHHRRRRMADVGLADARPEAVLTAALISRPRIAGDGPASGVSSNSSRGLAERPRRGSTESGHDIVEATREAPSRPGVPSRPDRRASSNPAFFSSAASFDSSLGGFGGAPKFPRRRRLQLPAPVLRARTKTRKPSTWCCSRFARWRRAA